MNRKYNSTNHGNVLYDRLSSIEIDTDLKSENNLKWLTVNLSVMSPDHAEMIQVLIIHHRHLAGGSEALPYNGMLLTKDRGVKYDLMQFPPELIKIIWAYLTEALK
jgi:hypothetical protein